MKRTYNSIYIPVDIGENLSDYDFTSARASKIKLLIGKQKFLPKNVKPPNEFI